PDEELGITPTEEQRTRKLLDTYSVPSDAVVTIRSSVASTWDEVLATRDWCRANQIRSLAVVTDPFPSRRVQWAYRRGFRQADLDTEIHIIPIALPRYRADNWWQDEAGLIAFQNEVIKLLYYRLKY